MNSCASVDLFGFGGRRAMKKKARHPFWPGFGIGPAEAVSIPPSVHGDWVSITSFGEERRLTGKDKEEIHAQVSEAAPSHSREF